ncbi:PiggyBac transposable element-derived protein [Trinorchestia longiramus]|nr:PiggyBac transposable element-derived protein [Trinorchestia longiramus]
MAKKRCLTEQEIAEILDTDDSYDDPDFVLSDDCASGSCDNDQEQNMNLFESSDDEEEQNVDKNKDLFTAEGESTEKCMDDNVNDNQHISDPIIAPDHDEQEENTESFSWTCDNENFIPRKSVPTFKETVVTADVNRSSSEFDIFMKLFPRSLFLQIAHYTFMRIDILNKAKPKAKISYTCADEIMVVLGCALVMTYNKVPSMKMYWSTDISLGNEQIKTAISRDRFEILFSKLYFTNPEKPENASNIYYIEEVLSCLKHTFMACRSESSFQSIDESMTKFKGRSSLRQYMPMKPVKRGIKTWVRSDAKTGYVYDANIYHVKDNELVERTLGERVVGKLSETIREPDVSLCFDRFFTSVNLIATLPYAAVGTCMRNRKTLPTFESKHERGNSEFYLCEEGLSACCWKDTKDVIVVSNCHGAVETEIGRKMKDGKIKQFTCPEAIMFYNKYMGGVDSTDRMVTLYELDRKSKKWWIKVFFKLMMTAVYNSYIIQCDVQHRKPPFITFLVKLAESMIEAGRNNLPKKRKRYYGRPSKTSTTMSNVGDHMPVKSNQRRRCNRCHSRKRERRTQWISQKCNIPLCIDECFRIYHT